MIHANVVDQAVEILPVGAVAANPQGIRRPLDGAGRGSARHLAGSDLRRQLEGIELALVMLDTVPNPQRVTYDRPIARKPLPSQRRLLFDALMDDVSEALDHWAAWQHR